MKKKKKKEENIHKPKKKNIHDGIRHSSRFTLFSERILNFKERTGNGDDDDTNLTACDGREEKKKITIIDGI